MNDMLDLGPALLALAGTTLGAAITWATSSATRSSSERLAEQRILEDRMMVVRQLAVDAYATALDAVELLHDVYVEDSVLEPHSAEIEPQVRSNINRAREARISLHKVSALTNSGPLAAASSELATKLGELEYAWNWAQFAAKQMHRERKTRRDSDRFSEAMVEISAIRKVLLGVDAVLPSEEVATGVPTAESQFGRLRAAINLPSAVPARRVSRRWRLR